MDGINGAVRAQGTITQESVAQMVKDSVDRGEPNRELSTAGKYLLLAAMNLCAETVRNFPAIWSTPRVTRRNIGCWTRSEL